VTEKKTGSHLGMVCDLLGELRAAQVAATDRSFYEGALSVVAALAGESKEYDLHMAAAEKWKAAADAAGRARAALDELRARIGN
jgi:hypothetical protein